MACKGRFPGGGGGPDGGGGCVFGEKSVLRVCGTGGGENGGGGLDCRCSRIQLSLRA